MDFDDKLALLRRSGDFNGLISGGMAGANQSRVLRFDGLGFRPCRIS